MKHLPKWVIPIFALALLTGCDGCRDKAALGAMDVVPRGSPVVVTAPVLADLSRGLDGFVGQLTRSVGRDVVRRLRTGITAQVGIDPLKATAWKHAGIDAERPVALFIEPTTEQPLCALEVSDPVRFDKAIRGFMLRVDGANKIVSELVSGHEIITVGRPFGDAVVPVIHQVRMGRVVILAFADGRAGLVKLVEGLAKGESTAGEIGADPIYQKLTKRAGAGLIQIFLRGASAKALVGKELASLSDGAALSFGAGPTGLRFTGFAALGLEGLGMLSALPPAGVLAGRVEPGAAMFGLTQLLRPEGLAVLEKTSALAPLIAQADASMKKETGLDLRRDALGLFTGPATVSVYLSDLEALIGQLRGGNKSFREALSSVGVALTAELREPAKLAALLEQSRASLTSTRRTPLRAREVVVGDQSVTIFEPDREAPTLGWGIAGSHYFYGAGVGRAERTARYLLGEPADGEGMAEVLAKGPAAELAKAPGASVMIIRTAEVADGLKNVLAKLSGQAEKLGAGKAVASVIELVGTFGDIALSVQPAADGLEFSIRERLQ